LSTRSLIARKDGARVRLYSRPGVRSYPITPAYAFDLIELNGAHVTGLLWRQLRECLLYLPTNNEIARSASPIAFVFQILQE
jgi:hypothetical protein